MNLHGARDFIINKLKTELDPFYYYHNVWHTEDVHIAVVRFAESEQMSEKEKILVETAAYYHDSGILIKYIGHEEESAKIAKEVLPNFGYSDTDIGIITGMILSTYTNGTVDTLAKKILCDADLDYLGRPDYFIIAQRLRLEWSILGEPISLKNWYISQVKYFEAHNYYTQSAMRMRNKGKEENLRQIKELLSF
jgi:predicted metal-dependent HD superfamily phosphohydrolase